MKPQDHIPALHATAAVMLPGMRQARALLDVAIRVCEYFDRHAARDVATRTFTAFTPAPKSLQIEVEKLKALTLSLHATCTRKEADVVPLLACPWRQQGIRLVRSRPSLLNPGHLVKLGPSPTFHRTVPSPRGDSC